MYYIVLKTTKKNLEFTSTLEIMALVQFLILRIFSVLDSLELLLIWIYPVPLESE